MARPEIPQTPSRPARVLPTPVPPLPDADHSHAEEASVTYSHYRTTLSHQRTGLSEHRTDLSEFRSDLASVRTELAMRRSGMAVQRTRMAADRTLMAEIRTSLSMIGFGFTLYEAFRGLQKAQVLAAGEAPRNFGLILIVLGMLILIGGIWRHVQFAQELRERRSEMVGDHLIHGDSSYPLSVSLVVAMLLLVVGLIASLNILFNLTLLG